MMLKRPAKDERERLVLLALVELYLETGKPIGSNTLRDEKGFEDLSSATIRNYFARLERGGYLIQQHSSGGRIPTELAYRAYAQHYLDKVEMNEINNTEMDEKLSKETREVAAYLQKAAEVIAKLTHCAVFLSSPRFDQDYVLDVKLVTIDAHRCLCILVTEFGMVHTEVIYIEEGLDEVNFEKVTSYLHWRLSGLTKPILTNEEQRIASHLYKEIMLRHIVNFSNFSAEDIYKTGFSKLLDYPDFNNAAALASGLSLFENDGDLHKLLKKTCEQGDLCCFLGEDLTEITTPISGCSLILIPYKINQTIAGAIGILGPNRLPYRQLFGIMKTAGELISETLTNSLYKFKITFRKPNPMQIELESKSPLFAHKTKGFLLENKELE